MSGLGSQDRREVRAFVRRLVDLERKVAAASMAPRLVHSSIEDGAIHEYDRDGNLVGRIGKQPDGTHGAVRLYGPTPPVPAGLVAEGGPVSITAIWDGTYVNDIGRLDFHLVEIYASPEPFEFVEEATLVGAIPDPDGGRVTFARPVGTWYVGAVALSAAGRRSAVSELAVAEAASVLDEGVLQELHDNLDALADDLENLDETVLPDLRGRLQDAFGQIEDATGQITDAFDQIGAVDSKADQAAADASAAQTAAQTAQSAAEDAEQAALDAAGVAEGKGQVITQTGAPTGSQARAENLWIRLPDHKVHIYDGSEWVAATDPDLIAAASEAATARQEAQAAQDAADAAQQRADDAHDAAGTAQDTADAAMTAAGTKTTVTYSTSAPAGVGQTEGDTHRQRDSSGNIIAEWSWDGDAWVPQQITSEQISNLDVGKLTAGTAEIAEVVAQRIGAASGEFIELDAGRITTGEIGAARIAVAELFADMFAAHKITAEEADLGSLAADEGFIADLEAAIVRADTFEGRRFVGGTFEGARFEGTDFVGGTLNIHGVLEAAPNEGVAIGGVVSTYQDLAPTQHPTTNDFRIPLTPWISTPGAGAGQAVRLRLERSSNYRYSEGYLYLELREAGQWWGALMLGSFGELPLVGDGQVRSYQADVPANIDEIQVTYEHWDPDYGPAGYIQVSDLEVLQPASGSVDINGEVSAGAASFARANIDRLSVNHLDASGVTLLDRVNLRGDSSATAPVEHWLIIPLELRGRFRKYVIDLRASTESPPSSGVRPVVVRMNGDSNANYRSSANVIAPDGTNVAHYNTSGTAFPRTAYVGTYESIAQITLEPIGLGDVSYMSWYATGWTNHGSSGGSFFQTGGRWNVSSTEPLQFFSLGTNQWSDFWRAGSRAELWGYR